MSGRIITIAQQKGGSGKTTLAAHLAVALWRGGGRVALLDCDPQGSLGEWYEAREQTLGEAGTGLSFRTASGWGARREARSLARDYDFIVIDTPPKSDVESRPAIEVASLVAIPVQPTPIDLWATQPTLDMVAKEGVPSLLVINRAQPRAGLTQEITEAIRALGHPAASVRLGNRVDFAASMGEGLTIMETTPGSKGAEEVDALAAELKTHLRD
ncbi:ParA family partition ATPase [Ancylobacter amanitiformis]|uniref:Chromosome partitioning protein n=1 Tax=Ancylobacter amanitiformis TaxID=217069 RepID=A0ABU0LXG2_9HYPH|nr:ParA family partition ATPase [Ancylobacter amanitiformis]MDQ0513362.1 chromosome partitioning protein [Ancylobacter amanitiformis]